MILKSRWVMALTRVMKCGLGCKRLCRPGALGLNVVSPRFISNRGAGGVTYLYNLVFNAGKVVAVNFNLIFWDDMYEKLGRFVDWVMHRPEFLKV